MKPAVGTSEMTFEQARTRLEGAVERLEAIEPKLRHAHEQLLSPRWRTDLSTSPAPIEAVARSCPPLAQDLAAAQRLQARASCPELDVLVERVTQLTQALSALARKHVGGTTETTLDALLRATIQRGSAELPKPLQPGESVVLSSEFAPSTWLTALGLAGCLGAAGLAAAMRLGVDVDALVPVAIGAASAFTAISSSLVKSRSDGQLVLTTRRLLVKSKRADPIDVPLSEIPAGTIQASEWGRSVELTRPRRLAIKGLATWRKLAVQLELERWLHGLDAAPPGEVRWNATVIPYAHPNNRSEPTTCALVSTTGFAILPSFPIADVRHKLGPLLGATPRVPIHLTELFAALRRLEPAKAEAAFEALAVAFGTTVNRERRVWRQKGYASHFGFDRDGRTLWFTEVTYAEMEALRPLLTGWETLETEGTR